MAATLMRIIINLSDKDTHIEEPLYSTTSSEIFFPQIRDSLPPNISLQDDEIEQYISVLIDEQVNRRYNKYFIYKIFSFCKNLVMLEVVLIA